MNESEADTQFMENINIVFLLTNILGGKTYSRKVEEIVAEMPWVTAEFLYFNYPDYKGLSKFQKKTQYLLPSACIRKKYDLRVRQEVSDLLFFGSFHFLPCFYDVIKTTPAVLAHDATNVLGHFLVYSKDKSLYSYLMYRIKSFLTSTVYRKSVENINAFIPRTSWCANSLKTDYAVPERKIFTSCGFIDLDLWNNETDTALVPQRKKPVLLFVGNDFLRKGGEFLLEMYRRYFSGSALLQIVSNDKYFENSILPSGVTVHKGYNHERINELIELYKNADLFLFPSTGDCLGLVLLEACSVGLPIIATDVGGVSDVVKDGYNGYLMPYGSSQEAWVNKIKSILYDDGKSRELGDNAREYAEANFAKSSFKKIIVKALEVAMKSKKQTCC